MKIFKFVSVVILISMLATSCKKYEDIVDAPYPEQQIYLPAAVEGNSTNGIYMVNKVAVPGQVFRYIADVPAKKFNIPLAVYRSGINTEGAITATIAANTDTIAKLLLVNKFPAGTEVLPVGKYTVESSATIGDGEGYKGFLLSIDQDFLLANVAKKFAIGIAASNSQKTGGNISTAIVLIDPALLVPVASFTNTISTRTVNFSNTSLNANAWLWEYGDGTPNSTEKAISHTYANAGTYTVKQTAIGALGDFNKSTFSATVVIP